MKLSIQTDRFLSSIKKKTLVCQECKEEKPISDFNILSTKHGKKFYSYACKSCQKEISYEQKEMLIIKDKLYAMNLACCDGCSNNKPLSHKCKLGLKPLSGKCEERDEFLYYGATVNSF